jgi:RNA polymerase-binding transcription factor DksA
VADKKYSALRSRLESEQKRLANELEQLRIAAYPTEERREGSPFGKREEEATESLELERRLALEKQIREQLADVEAALAKFSEGTYGNCENCGKPIDPERLEALPQAKSCVACKELQAKNAKGRFSPG